MKGFTRLREKVELLPGTPGVYKFYDKYGHILYVGKATNLRSRVSSYFVGGHEDRPHIRSMLPKVRDVEFLTTNNEVEAMILEAALIKEYQPKYNVLLKDDKSYAWLYINTADEFPTVKIIRDLTNVSTAKGRVFGPYPHGRAIRQVYRYIRKLYPFATCRNTDKPCFYHHIGLCPCPRLGLISKEDYRKNIEEIIKFLQGKKIRHINRLEKRMRKLADELRFEEAIRLRDQIDELRHLGRQNKLVAGVSQEREFLERQMRYRRNMLKRLANEIGEAMGLVLDVGELMRIECFDISNISGRMAYGSMVVAVNGGIQTNEYRVFKIRSKDEPDDYSMLGEVLQRRLAREDLPTPTTILIDGGKGHLGHLQNLVPEYVLLMGISKGRWRRKKGLRLKDQLWVRVPICGAVEGEEKYEILPFKVSDMSLLTALRDEAHRFAIRHHRKARARHNKKSLLDSIDGIGPKRRKALLQKFPSLDAIADADVNEIATIVRSKPLAEKIVRSLKSR